MTIDSMLVHSLLLSLSEKDLIVFKLADQTQRGLLADCEYLPL